MSAEDTPSATPRESVYDAEISPLVAEILKICKRAKIPMFATFFLDESDDDGVLKCTSLLDHGAEETEETTRDDIANCHAVVSRGARVKTNVDTMIISSWRRKMESEEAAP